jgi:hypothetical protein
VVHAERLFDPDDDLGVLERALAVDPRRAELVPDERVDDVEAGDVEDLAPPAQPAGVQLLGREGDADVVGPSRAARRPRPPGRRWWSHRQPRWLWRRRRGPMANAGAPGRLVTTLSRYRRRPRAMACSVETPSGPRKTTNDASRTPRPEMPMGQHLDDEHGREEREDGGEAHHRDAQRLGGHQAGGDHHQLVEDADDEHGQCGEGLLAQLGHPEVDRRRRSAASPRAGRSGRRGGSRPLRAPPRRARTGCPWRRASPSWWPGRGLGARG